MPARTVSSRRMIFASLTVALLATSSWAGEKVLHSFGTIGSDGQQPLAVLIFDQAGNLYGTTYAGGTLGLGTVFEMTPDGSGGWTTTVLHNFGQDTDGAKPWAGLTFDAAGNLYGTTYSGGSRNEGAVFKMSPNGSGGWTERVIHNFGISGTDGQNPEAGVIFDGAGNLYGTTYNGGSHSFGVVFEMLPNGSGGWTERVLHNFGASSMDGQNLWAGLIFDSSGNLYGTTYAGGSRGQGTVFQMSPNGSGGWTERVIHNFGAAYDGTAPERGSLVRDSAGNLYGITFYGGGFNLGTAYKVSPNGSGGWTEAIIHSFGRGHDGANPYSGLILDGSGNFYGTTGFGGSNTKGTVFKISPNGSGGWTESILHNFGGTGDGIEPVGGVIRDSAGNLYGTTYNGGSNSWGTGYEITP